MLIQARREGGGGFSRAPRRFGGPAAPANPPSLKNTEKGVPGGFFLTSNIGLQKIHFRPGLFPEPQ